MHTTEAFQAQLLDSVQESVVATDLDGVITYWGPGAERLYGYEAAEVLGQSVTLIVDNAEEDAERSRLKTVLEEGHWRGEYQQRRKDGSTFWASTVIFVVNDDLGRPAGFIGIDIDITERKQTNEEIHELELAIENAMQGISRLDRHGRFTMVKPQYARMLGYDSDRELVGKSWEVTVPPEDRPASRQGYELMLQEGKASLECRALRKDGSIFYKQLLLVKTFDERGQHNGHYCFMSDVTKRRQAEDQLRVKEIQLAHVSRLSTMGEMVAGIAHEINQPLYAIANLATVAQIKVGQLKSSPSEEDLKAELEEICQQISQQSVRAGDIIRRLQDFVRKTDGTYTAVDLKQVIKDAAAILSPMVRDSHATIRYELPETPLLVRADGVQLEQVFVNLIRNAIEAVAESDRREIHIHGERTDGGTVNVTVRDTGHGLDASDADKLFTAFYTTKRSGMGMGLAISRTIIEEHGGRIWAAPSPSGMSFHLHLPVSCKQDA